MARNNPVQVQVQSRNTKNTNSNSGGGNLNASGGGRGAKHHGASPKFFKSITPPMKCVGGGESSPPRLSPSRVTTPPASGGGSPRTSPGLLAGHYAGCKFTEPPLPSALPPPPQHWMQQPHAHRIATGPACAPGDQLAAQLKLLLKVQA